MFKLKDIEAMQRKVDAEEELSRENVSEDAENHQEMWIDLGDMLVCALNATSCDKKRHCEECDCVLPIPVQVNFWYAGETEKAYLFDASDTNLLIVQPKTPNAKLKEADLPEATIEQLLSLGIKKPKGFFVQTWSEKWAKKDSESRRFIKLAEPKRAGAMIVFVGWKGVPTIAQEPIANTKRYCEQIGAVDYAFANTSEYIDGADFGYEYWIFQYDPKAERLRIPCDPIEDKIDTLLHRQKIYYKLQPLQDIYLGCLSRRIDAVWAQLHLKTRGQLCEDIKLLEAMYDCFDTISSHDPDELRQFFIDVRGASITCGQSNLIRAAQACIDISSAENIAKARQAAKESLKYKKGELIETDQAIQASVFADRTIKELQAEIERLNPLIDQLKPQINALLSELGVDTTGLLN